jgi:hypothetical protein
MDPPFHCPDEEVSDAAFVKVTHTIGGRNVVEEYMSCKLFLLLVNFGLGEVTDGETHVSKLSAHMSDFPVAGLPEETNNRFRKSVELVAANVVGRYTRGEHKVCIEVLPNQCRVNWVFEHVGVPYGPRLEPSFEASEEAAKKRRQDTSVGSLSKRVKVSGRKAAHAKIPVVKAAQSKSASRAKTVPGAGILPKAMVSSAAYVSMVATTMTSPRAGVLKICVGMNRPGAASSPTTKGKQARLDVGPPLTSTAPLQAGHSGAR